MKVGQKWYVKRDPSSWFVVINKTRDGYTGVWEDGTFGLVTYEHFNTTWRRGMRCQQEIHDLIKTYYETR